MVISDETLKEFLVFIGVTIGHIKPCMKICAVITVSFCYASLIYQIIASFKLLFSPFIKIGISQILLTLSSSLIWLTCFFRRKKFTILIQKFFSFRNRYGIEKNSSTFIQLFIAILILLLFMVSQVQHFVVDSQSTFAFWTLNAEIPEGASKSSIIIVINLINFATYFFPVFVTFILSIILYKFADFFHFYNTSLKSQLRVVKKCKRIEFLEDFPMMLKLQCRMNELMNYPLFFPVLYSLHEIFKVLHFLILNRGVLRYSLIVDVILTFTCSGAMLVMYSICSSMVTENMTKVTVTAREKVNSHVFGTVNSIPLNVLLCLKRIEKEKIVYVSVCDLFHLSKSFILSAIGITLSYDLLIITALMNDGK